MTPPVIHEARAVIVLEWCRACGAAHAARSLPLVAVIYGGGEAIDARRCPCGALVPVVRAGMMEVG